MCTCEGVLQYVCKKADDLPYTALQLTSLAKQKYVRTRQARDDFSQTEIN